MEIRPVDLEALKRNQKPWDPYYIAAVLSDILSRERGCQIKIVLTPKTQDEIDGG